MYNPLVSIIIPVYNGETWLGTCLDSILCQSLTDWEAIMVDDGSNDCSYEIAERYCGKDGRLHLLKQSNQGPSAARNRGMCEAKGEYICFVDNDDLLFAYGLEYLLHSVVKNGADMVAGNVICLYEDGHCSLFRPYGYTNVADKVVSGVDYFDRYTRMGIFTMMIYNYIYRRSFLCEHHLWLDTYITHEDELWTPQALILAKTLVATRICHYFYRQHTESITGKHQIHRYAADAVYTKQQLLTFAENYQGAEKAKVKECLQRRIGQIDAYISDTLQHQ
jgi:glycosyltransferase involved in cell wall biosynthesis